MGSEVGRWTSWRLVGRLTLRVGRACGHVQILIRYGS